MWPGTCSTSPSFRLAASPLFASAVQLSDPVEIYVLEESLQLICYMQPVIQVLRSLLSDEFLPERDDSVLRDEGEGPDVPGKQVEVGIPVVELHEAFSPQLLKQASLPVEVAALDSGLRETLLEGPIESVLKIHHYLGDVDGVDSLGQLLLEALR